MRLVPRRLIGLLNRLESWNPMDSPALARASDGAARALGRRLRGSRSDLPLALAGLLSLLCLGMFILCLGTTVALAAGPFALLEALLSASAQSLGESLCAQGRRPSDAPWRSLVRGASWRALRAVQALCSAFASVARAARIVATALSAAAWSPILGHWPAATLASGVALAYAGRPELASLPHGRLARAVGLNPYALICSLAERDNRRKGGERPPLFDKELPATMNAERIGRCAHPGLAAWAAKPCGLLGSWMLDSNPSWSPLDNIAALACGEGRMPEAAREWARWARSLAERGDLASSTPPTPTSRRPPRV